MGGPAAAAADRFEIRGRLGAGATGVVHRAFDRVRGCDVAIKSLVRAGGRELYRFKREFRALADLAHPNLAALHELYTVDDEWMFTMELVDGVPFLDWVRPAPGRVATEDEPTATSATAVARPLLHPGELDEARLRDALGQLADGLVALHGAGKLHRDIKPSNVLVEGSGRVVILDFGLVADFDFHETDKTHERGAIGTPAYMSPEQASDRPLTEASDWYAVGVMLYEALTGHRLIDGPADVVLRRKQELDRPRPGDVAPGVPADLDALCAALLARDPATRADGHAVLAALGRAPSAATERILDQAARPPFVGRAAELAALRAAAAAARARSTTCVVVGPSGMGKSALVRAFLDEASAAGEVAILEGRCYERESVPFKALDGVIDDLTALLVRLPPEELARVVPRDLAALLRLFPVFRRIPELAAPSLSGGGVDPVAIRRRALDALRALLGALAAARPVVIAIDDLQWGDVDSAAALAELIRGDDAPRLLLICAHRAEDATAGELLAELRRAAGERLVEIDVGALGEADARALWTELRGGDDGAAAVRDAGGNPMLLTEIARLGAGASVQSVDDAVRARLSGLPDDARALLRTVAVAARPIATELMIRAARVGDGAAAVAALRMERLVRLGGAGLATIEPSHDRIREAVISTMTDDERRGTHGAIAAALADADTGDRELLVEHWLGAGDGAVAARYAELAAREAEQRLALHRATDLYGIALLHGDLDDARRGELAARRAEALAAAGRVLEAAVEYQNAAALVVAPRARRDLRRRSVEQLVRAGHVDRGIAAAHALLRSVGVRMPRGWRRTIVALLVERLRLRLRGLAFAPRAADDIELDDRDRIDLLYSIASGFTFVDPVLVRVLATRMLRLALRAGEPRRLTLALGLELGYRATHGYPATPAIEELFGKASALADDLGQDELRGFVETCGGVAAYLAGRFRVARTRLVHGEAMLRDNPREMHWQLDTAEIFLIATLWNLGEIEELVRLHPGFLRAAVERGNVYLQRGLRGWRSNVVWLIQGDPATARAQATLAAPDFGEGGPYHLHHYYDLLAHSWIDLYERRQADVFARVERDWPRLARSLTMRIQAVDIESHFLRGSAAVAGGALAIAERCVRRLVRHRSPLSRALAAQLRGAIEATRGDRDRARAALAEAISLTDEQGMAAHRAAAEMRLGVVEGGAGGRARFERAVAWFAARGVADPVRLAGVLSPGVTEP